MAKDDPAPRPHPLERLSAGGWKGGVVRLAIGALIVAVVVRIGGGEAWQRIRQPALLPAALGGAALHLAQRACRIAKWSAMLREVDLHRTDFPYLMRAQLVGMMGNLLVPVSEAVKIWAVSRERRDVFVASASIVSDTALHAAGVAAAGTIGALALGIGNPWVWGPAATMLVAALGVVAAVARMRHPRVRLIRHGTATIACWTALETACQLGVYAVALSAIGVSVSPGRLLALAPILFLSDLVMVTPSGLGVREALFAATLELLGDAPADAGVAAGLLISGMLFVAALAGGTVGLVWGRRSPE